MLSNLLLLCISFAATNALTCVTDGTITYIEYFQGVIVQSSSHDFSYGYVDCSANLNRCATFKSMNITDFVNLDAGKDGSAFAQMVRSEEGQVAGRCCMSQADADKIGAVQADKCDNSKAGCSCTTDHCTGAAGAVFSMLSIVALLGYSVCHI
ncbi:hypothetical protein PRIPAC_82360 [Pristionchus pacificus]|uniref:Uncharacterized protein n=1 Tax=Pristionchus pacificus TaxID=54126 RepID=A0A2A6CKN8_PRIPA|nr:hypothetical protein PRIPAC_82360 [Pristionchus pacificus]|eukprot:PDM78784.1 hypothetical protein PRIPAC_31363 [Pristionchus pacificus]